MNKLLKPIFSQLPARAVRSWLHGVANCNAGAVGKTISRSLFTTPIRCVVKYEPPDDTEPGPRRWPRYNAKVFPPQRIEDGEPRRPAYVCHMNLNFKYSPEKLWYVAVLMRGMSIDEALRQVDYVQKKGAFIVKKTLMEAQDLAVREHNVEFRSNLWVAESFVGRGLVIKGMRRHARGKIGMIDYRYCHYFVRLEEGKPPAKYYTHVPDRDAPTLLQEWIQKHRDQRIYLSV